MTTQSIPAQIGATRAMDALRRIVHVLHGANATSIGTMRVTAAQLFVLRQIGLSPRLSLSDLAIRTRSAASSVSEVVSRLVAIGLVSRVAAKDDARRAELKLTTAGRHLIECAGETVQERLVAGFESLPVAAREQLASALEEWLERSGFGAVHPRMFFEDETR